MKKAKVIQASLALFLLISAVALASCGNREERLSGYLYLRLGTNPTSLDPALVVDISSAAITAKLYNGLVRFDDNLKIVPDVSAGWDISADGRLYTFNLRDDARFPGGRLVTAKDFKYSFERVLTPSTKSPRSWVLDRIEGAREFSTGEAKEVSGLRVINPTRLEIRLKERFPPFLGLLAMPTAYVVPREDVERWGDDFGSHPVGSGPYRLTEWKQGRGLRLDANNGYFGGKPQLTGIFYRIIPDEMTTTVEFDEGNLDIIGVPAPEYGRYRREPALSRLLVMAPGLDTYYIGLNCRRPPFDNPLVRRAMNHAIDRDRILRTILEGRGILASGPIPPMLLAPEEAVVEGYRYDPAESRSLLAEAGYPKGIEVSLYLNLDQDTLDILEVVQEYLRQAGIKAHLKQLEWSAFKAAVLKGEADAFWLSWWADYPDPENFLFPLFHSSNFGAGGNRARFSDPETDRLIEAAAKAPTDDERNTFYRMAQRRVVDLAPWVFMWHKADVSIHQPWVKGVRSYPLAAADKGMDVTIDRRLIPTGKGSGS